MKKVGFITVGQSPRDDIIPEMSAHLRSDVEIIQNGALDGLDLGDIEKLHPQKGEALIVTRMRDGTEVHVSKEKVTPLVQERIRELETEKADLIVLLCTGAFQGLMSQTLLVEPGRLFKQVVRGVLPRGRLGILIPSPEQVEQVRKKWEAPELELFIEATSPYEELAAVETAAKKLAEVNPDLIALDCLGFEKKRKKMISTITSKPIIMASSILARICGELTE